jgi:hypothetical protein
MIEIIEITAAYSNAVLVAILPQISDFSKKLDLPIKQPIPISEVAQFRPSPYKGRIEGPLWLNSGYWFMFDHRGYVQGFRSPKNFFTAQEDAVENVQKYLGHTRMSTNEIVALARKTLHKLGYKSELTYANREPELQGPSDLNQGGHVPYARVRWRVEEGNTYNDVYVDINTEDKSIVGLYLGFTKDKQVGTPLKINVEPEVKSGKRKSIGDMYVRTNAPSHPSVVK